MAVVDTFKNVRSRLRELIGAKPYFRTAIEPIAPNFPTVDARRTDYAFWDRARRGSTVGMELSGLFLKPLGSKVSAWVLGPIPGWQLDNEPAEDFLKDWWMSQHPKILRGYEESLDLGDCYLVINSDLSVTLIPPHVVTPLFDENDPSLRIGWKIREVYPVWGAYENVVIVDEYTDKQRVRYIERNGVATRRKVFPNVIGKNPVIHIANLLGADEMFGRPEGEALVNALHRYGDVIDAALKGNIRQGRPTPVIEKMGTADQVDKFWQQYGRSETRTLPDGTTETTMVIDFDPDQLLTLGGEAQFRYESPEPFSTDTQNLLQLIFYLVLQHTEIPEFVWGNAIGASKASADSQLEPFVKWLTKKRAMAAGWLTDIAEVVLAYMAVLRPDIAEVEQSPIIQWSQITSEDAKVTLLAVQWAYENHLLPSEEALDLVPLEVADPKTSVEKGLQEFEEWIKKLQTMGLGADGKPQQSVSEKDLEQDDDAENRDNDNEQRQQT